VLSIDTLWSRPRFSAYGKIFMRTIRWLSVLCSQEILKCSICRRREKRHFELHPYKIRLLALSAFYTSEMFYSVRMRIYREGDTGAIQNVAPVCTILAPTAKYLRAQYAGYQ
jgi:hypothetical protein